MEFKDRIRWLREEKGLDLTKLAAEFDMKEAGVRAWELGRTKPGANMLVKLARYFGCTTDYLLGVSDIRSYSADEKDNEISFLRDKEHATEKFLKEMEKRLNETLHHINTFTEIVELLREHKFNPKEIDTPADE